MKDLKTDVCPGCKKHCNVSDLKCKWGVKHFKKIAASGDSSKDLDESKSSKKSKKDKKGKKGKKK